MSGAFGKQIVTLRDGGPQEPSLVLEAFSEESGSIRLTLRPVTREAGYQVRLLSKYDAARLGPILVGEVLEYTTDLIWRRA